MLGFGNETGWVVGDFIGKRGVKRRVAAFMVASGWQLSFTELGWGEGK